MPKVIVESEEGGAFAAIQNKPPRKADFLHRLGDDADSRQERHHQKVQ
jgi:hypothetical protein